MRDPRGGFHLRCVLSLGVAMVILGSISCQAEDFTGPATSQEAVGQAGTGEGADPLDVQERGLPGVPGSPLDSTIKLLPLQLSSLTLSPPSVTGGTSSQATVTLSRPVPAGGAVITISSSNTALATIHPASTISVPAGAVTHTFYVWTVPVAANPNVIPPGVSVVITATPASGVSGAAKTATLTVLTPTLKAFGVNPFNPYGGRDAGGYVQLTGPAPAGGAVVHLSSSNPLVAAVPASVTVAPGQCQQIFTVPTSAVATISGVDFTAQRNAFDQKKASIAVLPPVLGGMSCPPTPFVGGTYVPCSVLLIGRVAPGATVVVALTSTNPEIVTIPANVTLVSGAESQTFDVITKPVANPASVTISGSYRGVTKTGSLQVKPPAVQSVALTPTSVEGGLPVVARVTLSGVAPAPFGASVQLASSNPGIAAMPPSVRVQDGKRTADVTVNTGHVDRRTYVNISASYGGATQSDRLTVRPIE